MREPIRSLIVLVSFLLPSAQASTLAIVEVRLFGYIGNVDICLVNKATFEVCTLQREGGSESVRSTWIEAGDYSVTVYGGGVIGWGTDCLAKAEWSIKPGENDQSIFIPTGSCTLSVDFEDITPPRVSISPSDPVIGILRPIGGNHPDPRRWHIMFAPSGKLYKGIASCISEGSYSISFVQWDPKTKIDRENLFSRFEITKAQFNQTINLKMPVPAKETKDTFARERNKKK